MKIIISPAKKMNIDTDTLEVRRLPQFLDEAKRLCAQIQKLDYAQAKALWKCNDKLARLNFQRFAKMDLERNLTPAILAYEGLQYQYMAPGILTQEALDYLQRHLLNFQRFAKMDLERNLTPAILAYEGLQYQYMAPGILTQEALDYLQRHLRILSGFYGVLSPFDGVVPYRLEMQANVSIARNGRMKGKWCL